MRRDVMKRKIALVGGFVYYDKKEYRGYTG
jgi:hypothetical protein